MGDAARARKVADRIKVVVADFLEFRIRDERLGFVTITDVRVTGDLQNATVFYTVLGGDPERAATAAALESNTGRIRSVVGKALGIRLTPTIAFVADAPRRAAYLEGSSRRPRRAPSSRRPPHRPATPVSRTRTAEWATTPPTASPRPSRPTPRERAARRPARRRQPGRVDLARCRRPGPPARRHPQGRPCGHPRPDAHRRARPRPGAGTRLFHHLVGCDKSYAATIRLGQSTVTDDAEGEVLERAGATSLDPDALAAAVASLTGPVSQVPSAVSAIKVDGQRAYARVRAGEDVELRAREVVVHRFAVCGPPRPTEAEDGTSVVDLDVEVDVSSGTYVRALARDLGRRLGTGDTSSRCAARGSAPSDSTWPTPWPTPTMPRSTSPRPSSRWPLRPERTSRHTTSTTKRVSALRHGRTVAVTGGPAGPAAAFAPDGSFVAVIEVMGGRARPTVVVPDVP